MRLSSEGWTAAREEKGIKETEGESTPAGRTKLSAQAIQEVGIFGERK